MEKSESSDEYTTNSPSESSEEESCDEDVKTNEVSDKLNCSDNCNEDVKTNEVSDKLEDSDNCDEDVKTNEVSDKLQDSDNCDEDVKTNEVSDKLNGSDNCNEDVKTNEVSDKLEDSDNCDEDVKTNEISDKLEDSDNCDEDVKTNEVSDKFEDSDNCDEDVKTNEVSDKLEDSDNCESQSSTGTDNEDEQESETSTKKLQKKKKKKKTKQNVHFEEKPSETPVESGGCLSRLFWCCFGTSKDSGEKPAKNDGVVTTQPSSMMIEKVELFQDIPLEDDSDEHDTNVEVEKSYSAACIKPKAIVGFDMLGGAPMPGLGNIELKATGKKLNEDDETAHEKVYEVKKSTEPEYAVPKPKAMVGAVPMLAPVNILAGLPATGLSNIKLKKTAASAVSVAPSATTQSTPDDSHDMQSKSKPMPKATQGGVDNILMKNIYKSISDEDIDWKQLTQDTHNTTHTRPLNNQDRMDKNYPSSLETVYLTIDAISTQMATS
uniref:Protein starmaker-like n=1 Tax=Saccoglossus kowalevskii TaxID=10224 RepID=A0ABM0MLH4_SACKO